MKALRTYNWSSEKKARFCNKQMHFFPIVSKKIALTRGANAT